MAARGQNANRIGEILDQLEKAGKEVSRSLDPMRDTLNYDRLQKAREGLGRVLAGLDTLLSERPG